MGFDIECIVDISSYPGEYFCPVCRTLVYPHEAFQTQCTHLYCKPCLAHIANGTKACPYDGYLVTESDSKLLTDSDKALAENIGKVKVHCLFFRSGCTWEGTLADCTSHCSVCTFGNSPVICNRCGIQIVHRQVHEHAQICSGVAVTTSAATTEVNQTVPQSGPPPPQAQNPQTATTAPVPGQNPNFQVNASSQPPAIAPVAVPTPDQWYQQQYQQYYQQYAGYDPYQQHNQQYYALQQPPLQQYQQAHMYTQPQGQQQPQLAQPQAQPDPAPQAAQQSHPQSHAQGQAQSQPQSQMQLPPQAPPQGQNQAVAPHQALTPNYQVNPQQPYPAVRPQTQIPPQTLPPPPQSQPPPFAQGVRPPAQHPQVPQYQQPHVQMHHPQSSQAHVQPQMQPQPHIHSSNQSYVQPQGQPYHAQSQPPSYPPQFNQSTAPPALPQAPHQPVPPVSGHHSYQPQPTQKMQTGASLGHPHPASGTVPPVQLHGQVPPQPAVMRPSLPHSLLPQQQQSMFLPPQNPASGTHPTQNQQYPPQMQQSAYPLHRPVMQPVQQAPSQQYAQQQHFVAPVQNQLHQQGNIPQQQPMQPQMRPPGPPQPQQSQGYIGRPVMPIPGVHPQTHPVSSAGFGPQVPSGPTQIALNENQMSINQNYERSTVLEQNSIVPDSRSPSKGLVEKDLEGEVKEAVKGQNEAAIKDADNESKAGLVKPVIKQEDNTQVALEQASGGKPFEAGAVEDAFSKEEGHVLDSDLLKQEGLDNQKKYLSKTMVVGSSSANFDKQSQNAISFSSIEGQVVPPQSHGSHEQRPETRVQGQPPQELGPQGPAILRHPGQSLNPSEGRTPGYYGSPNSFESAPRGFMGRGPQLSFEGQYGTQHAGRSSDADQMSGPGEGGSLMKSHAGDPSLLRMNGGPPPPDTSMFGSMDEKSMGLSREHLNPFRGDRTRTLDQATRSLDKVPHGPAYDAGAKLDPGTLGPNSRFAPHHPSIGHGHTDMFGRGPEFGQHHMKHFTRGSADREFHGTSPRGFGGRSSFHHGGAFDDINPREAHRYGEGSFNPSSDPVGNPFRDGRYPPVPGHLRTGDIDGPGNPRFGEHMGPGMLHNQMGSDDAFGPDGPGHLMRGKFSGQGYLPGHFGTAETAGHGAFPGHGRVGEMGGPGNFARLPFTEPIRGNRPSFPHFGDARNNYSLPGFGTAGNFAGGVDSFDQTRKRKPPSTAWCRICEVDCDTVEGLDMHSQTRDHQKMAMDMVKMIKMHNKKKQRTGADKMVHEGGSRSRKRGTVGRGSKR